MNMTCAHCGKPATKPAAEIRRAERRGTDLYCGRECSKLGRTKPLADRFWAKVNKNAPGGCWEWTGKRCVGYGHIAYQGESRVTHRIALMLLGWKVPDELHVDHVCRNRACCNPDHLRLVTPRVNALENNLSPYAANARKTHCKNQHPLEGRHVIVLPARGAKGQRCKQRLCVACYVMRRPTARTLRGKPISYYLHVLGKDAIR